jgi:hypothetical protein
MGFRLPFQQQLILQQPNGLIWMRVCAKLRIIPTLQQVHQYDAALKLVTDDGHKASEEIYTCIVSEQHKHLLQQKQQQQALNVNKQRFTAVMASNAPLTVLPPVVSQSYGERSYSVGGMSLGCHKLTAHISLCRMVRNMPESSRRASFTELERSSLPSVATTAASGAYHAHMCKFARMIRLIAAQGRRQEARQGCHAVRLEWQVQQRAVLMVLAQPQISFSRHLIGIFRDALTSVCRRSAGDKYDGEWVHHQRHGNCIYTWSSGEVLASMRRNIWRGNAN